MFFIFLLSLLPLLADYPQVVGVGEPIIDYIYQVDDEFLDRYEEEKGGSRKIDYRTFVSYQNILKEQQPSIIPGGSCAVTIKGLAKLGVNCRFIGKVGEDKSGDLFFHGLVHAGVIPQLLTTNTHTSLLLSLVTPDGQRTMRCCFGAANELKPDELTYVRFLGATHVHLEGYCLYNDRIIHRAIKRAKQSGATVSLDLSSFEVVRLFKEEIHYLLNGQVDVVFANEDEAYELTGLPPREACEMLRQICKVAVVLVGKEGCWVGSNDCVFQSKPPQVQVVDTIGAGDLFASGFLYGYVHGLPLPECARIGNLLGSTCVQTAGAEIPDALWETIFKQVPNFDISSSDP